jgi:hypothetical protein
VQQSGVQEWKGDLQTILRDVRVTLRAFRRSPGFPLTAIATPALGIGATTAIFTTLSAVLLKPLPYPNPQDLYSVRTALTEGRVTTGLLSGGEIFLLNDPRSPRSPAWPRPFPRLAQRG